ncbi:3-deoxy-manno-octulosonate cytidylyltransferase [Wenzhouxiangella sp. XN79A]|uniref:3-deoxy-manno-octulosonate cytidylyltransferase n=1 Tax=Wenzhouxiangella sp. XN79A TaxID=2724193 RepID=UPI00144AF15C|nr:3-deoxy-manno-octulosonate cytidylyltransferase [Wenzhouxiangella sp. XN79A]NKI35480.1 3-deoxy-manno-octulosonate cytidylyltransferase [Wenzhouxiangella sp. XN79A]
MSELQHSDRGVFHVMIPARLESTRLPRKALADLGGRPLIVRVVERALTAGAASVHVATDSQAITEAVEAAGGRVVPTATDHDSGTSRLAEAVERLALDDAAVVVNVQGDEPAVPVACIHQLAALLESRPDAEMATLWTRIEAVEEWRDPNVVKLIADASGNALYFSRAPVPAVRDGDWPAGTARRHVGLYAYRVGALRRWNRLPRSRLAELESLEQLRALEAGWRIVVAEGVEPMPPGVDTPADLEAMRTRFASRGDL